MAVAHVLPIIICLVIDVVYQPVYVSALYLVVDVPYYLAEFAYAVPYVRYRYLYFGIFCGKRLALDMFPETSYPMVMVQTYYGNADPEEVERNVTRPLESAFSGLSGLKHISSTSSTGYSQIMLEFSSSVNMDSVMNDVRDKIDRARSSLSPLASSPTATQLDASLISLMTLVMKGNHSAAELYEYAENIVEPALEQIDGIASCDISGGQERCIKVSVSLDRLEAYSLSLPEPRKLGGNHQRRQNKLFNQCRRRISLAFRH